MCTGTQVKIPIVIEIFCFRVDDQLAIEWNPLQRNRVLRLNISTSVNDWFLAKVLLFQDESDFSQRFYLVLIKTLL